MKNYKYQFIIERANGAEFPADLRARLAAHSFPKSLKRIAAYYGTPKIVPKGRLMFL